MDRIRGVIGQGRNPTLVQHSGRLPQHGALFVRQSDKFIGLGVCCLIISAVDIGRKCVSQRDHQGGGMADLARITDRVVRVRERGRRRQVVSQGDDESWPRKTGQGVKWIFCLTAA